MQFRLRTKYVLTLVTLVAAVTVATLVAQRTAIDRIVAAFELENLERLDTVLSENARNQAVLSARTTADRLLEPLFAEDIQSVGNIIRPLVEREDVRAVMVFGRDGTVFHDGSQKLPSFGDAAPADVLATLNSGHMLLDIDAFDFRVVEPIVADGYVFGVIAVNFDARYIGAEISAMRTELTKVSDAALQELALILALIGLVALVLAGIAAAILAGRMSRPVRDLARVAQSISTGNFEVELASRRSDELGELAQAFDEMAENLRDTMVTRSQLEVTVAEQTRELRQTHGALIELESRRRHVLDEIGDDLRAPITEIESDITVALRNQDSALELRHSMSRVLFQIRDVRRLVDDLRFAARSEQPRRLGRSSD
ncbi:MAG: HAMP domain-containing protein [Alphaproteobacteria bacterium]